MASLNNAWELVYANHGHHLIMLESLCVLPRPLASAPGHLLSHVLLLWCILWPFKGWVCSDCWACSKTIVLVYSVHLPYKKLFHCEHTERLINQSSLARFTAILVSTINIIQVINAPPPPPPSATHFYDVGDGRGIIQTHDFCRVLTARTLFSASICLAWAAFGNGSYYNNNKSIATKIVTHY